MSEGAEYEDIIIFPSTMYPGAALVRYKCQFRRKFFRLDWKMK